MTIVIEPDTIPIEPDEEEPHDPDDYEYPDDQPYPKRDWGI